MSNKHIVERDFSSIVAALFPKTRQVAMVEEPSKPPPTYSKFPGGRGEDGETPEEAGVRELEEETGFVVRVEDLVLLTKVDKGNHDLYFFAVIMTGSSTITKERGDEGELISLVDCDELDTMVDFLPPHRKLLEMPEVIEKLRQMGS